MSLGKEEIKVPEVIKVVNQLTSKYGDYPGLSEWVHWNHKDTLNMEEGGRGINASVMHCEKYLIGHWSLLTLKLEGDHGPRNVGSPQMV